MSEQYFQGDIMFVRLPERLSKKDDGIKPVPPQNGKYILARGEKTGHTHTVEAGPTTLYEGLWGGYQVLVVDKETPVLHDEHPPLVLPVGDYEIRLQRRHDYNAREERRVLD